MAIRNTKLGGTDFTEEGLKPTDFNDTNNAMYGAIPKPHTIYTGTAFDASNSTSSSTVTNNHTLTIPGGVINDYILIGMTASIDVSSNNISGNYVSGSIKIETSETTLGVWTTQINPTIVCHQYESESQSGATTLFYYQPTASEKTNGLDIRFTGTATIGAGGIISVNNNQIVIYTA